MEDIIKDTQNLQVDDVQDISLTGESVEESKEENVGESVEESKEESAEESAENTQEVKTTKKRNIQKIGKKVSKKTTEKFSKEQFYNSKTYSAKKDLITALLKDDLTYSKSEVEEIINNYLKGEI